MPRREDDDVARRSSASGTRTLVLAGGFALAVLATLSVFLTDNPRYLRIAVVAVAWAFVLATFAAGRRAADRVAAEAREEQLRQVYERELDREVVARREYELELENELRLETEDAMRHELEALRGDIASLAGLRDEVARVSDLRGDVAGLRDQMARVSDLRDDVANLAGLRDDLARLSDLRDDVASLASLRTELGQLAELRADMGRLRAELTEQLSSELLVERIVMRTQAYRLPGADQPRSDAPGRSFDATPAWRDDLPPRELTGGWPAIRLDEPRPTHEFERTPVTGTWSMSPPPPPSAVPPPVPEVTAGDAPPTRFDLFGPASSASESGSRAADAGAHSSRHSADERPAPPATTMSPVARPPVHQPPAPSPLEWLSSHSLLDPPAPEPPPRPSPRPRPSARPAAARSLPEVPPRRRRPENADQATTERPVPAGGPPPARPDVRTGLPVPVRDDATSATGPTTRPRVDDILADNVVNPPAGGRRRRRYREDDDSDDVLARVLRQN